MFQTELILYLQSLGGEWLKLLMTVIGNEALFVIVPVVVLLGVSFRKGFFLIQILLWTATAADVLKRLFALPRPFDVETQVQILETWEGWSHSELTGMGAKGFFQLFDRQTLEAVRPYTAGHYGFPSGHVSSTTAIWGSIALLFRKTSLLWIAVCMIVMMALSRMYMGSHFLADVLGGAALGGTILLMVHQLSAWYSLHDHVLAWSNTVSVSRHPDILFLCLLFLAPLLLALIGGRDSAGKLLGINTGFLLVMFQGCPDDSGTLKTRIARVLIGVLVFFATEGIVETGLDLAGLKGMAWSRSITGFMSCFMVIWGTVTICVKSGLYKRAHTDESVRMRDNRESLSVF